MQIVNGKVLVNLQVHFIVLFIISKWKSSLWKGV